MARVGRWLIRLLTVISAAMCLAAGGLWVRSQSRSDVIEYWHDSIQWYDDWWLGTIRGGLVVSHARAVLGTTAGTDQRGSDRRGWSYHADEADAGWAAWTWPTYRHTGTLAPPNPDGAWSLETSHWLLVTVFGAPPAMAAVRFRRDRFRRRAGRCRRCGYDLRATPDRCPECGAAAGRSGSSGPGAGLVPGEG